MARYEDEVDEESEEEEGIEIPEWTPWLFGWVYKIYELDDGSIEVTNLPDWLELTFDFDTELWTLTADLPDLIDASWENADLNELFVEVYEALEPLSELFKV